MNFSGLRSLMSDSLDSLSGDFFEELLSKLA
jgi:hypothetical protein